MNLVLTKDDLDEFEQDMEANGYQINYGDTLKAIKQARLAITLSERLEAAEKVVEAAREHVSALGAIEELRTQRPFYSSLEAYDALSKQKDPL